MLSDFGTHGMITCIPHFISSSLVLGDPTQGFLAFPFFSVVGRFLHMEVMAASS